MKSYEKDGQRILVSADVDLDSDKMFESVEQKKEKQIKEQEFTNSNCLIRIKLQGEKEICGTLEQYACYKGVDGWQRAVTYRTLIFWVGHDDFSFLIKLFGEVYCADLPKVIGCSFEFLKGIDIPVTTKDHRLDKIEVLECNGPLFKISLLITNSD